MANKTVRSTQRVTCSKCGAEAEGIKDTYHRRCSGQPNQPELRDKHDKLPTTHRGRWQ